MTPKTEHKIWHVFFVANQKRAITSIPFFSTLHIYMKVYLAFAICVWYCSTYFTYIKAFNLTTNL